MDKIQVTDLNKLKESIANLTLDTAKPKNVHYADMRFEAGEGIGAYSEDGNPKVTSKDWGLSLGVRVIAGDGIAAAGYYGRQLGISDYKNFKKVLTEAFENATDRAKANSKYKTKFKKTSGELGKSIQPTKLAPIKIHKETIEAEYEIDPRSIEPKQITEFARNAASKAKKYHPNVKKVELVVNTGISRQIFASSEGTLIDQSQCSSGGTVWIIAQENGKQQADLYHHTGNQLGFEAISKGKNTHEKIMSDYAMQIADEAVQLSKAKPAPSEDKPVTVVLDPDLVALFAHEIIGHPSELDRAMKMEAGYAGRSWFMKDLKNNMIGKKVGSPLLTAFSDPTMKGGYGHYLYDDEGTKAKRVYHIEKGIYKDFMNSRQTAEIFGSEPNGHYKANDASVVPLIRMSNSAIAPGKSDPKKNNIGCRKWLLLCGSSNAFNF